jgi:hypothetical protein
VRSVVGGCAGAGYGAQSAVAGCLRSLSCTYRPCAAAAIRIGTQARMDELRRKATSLAGNRRRADDRHTWHTVCTPIGRDDDLLQLVLRNN